MKQVAQLQANKHSLAVKSTMVKDFPNQTSLFDEGVTC
ncbi:hypothetical protein RR47_GL000244 [Enterococcus columbae DSM 7374 = ATCC 51263]|nr:hypothetical protein RR47_GL000244 [Enterococcus columbae DSM 7374 = ATCC 51263]